MKKKINIISFCLMLILGITACEKQGGKQSDEVETMTSGSLVAYCDETIYDLLDTAFTLYDNAYANVTLEVIPGNAREIMARLLAGEARVVFVARDYLHDEDSLMQQFDVLKHPNEMIADDALCFFASKDFPLDTLNSSQILEILTDKTKNLQTYYPKLQSEPIIATVDQNSSIYANLFMLAAEGKPITRNIRLFSTMDSVKEFVKSTPNSIGVLYWHHIVRDLDFNPIMIGYHDSTGKYINPKPVHQAYIVQGLYPYIVTFKALMIDEQKKLPFWLSAYVAREAVVTRYLTDAGIVPRFAKFRLIKED